MNCTKGRIKKVVILQHRGWVIIVEPNFPGNNYVITKKGASHGFRPGYCSSLESALSMLFDQLVITNIEETDGYCSNLVDLRRMILKTKEEFKALLSNGVKAMQCEGGGIV